MTSYLPQLGDSISKIAAQELGDWRKWRDVADKNGLSSIVSIDLNASILMPTIEELQQKAQPIFDEVSTAIKTGGGQVISALQQIEAIVPGASGYSKVAQQALADVNGVLGQVSSVLTKKPTNPIGGNRSYDGTPKLIDWLLNDNTIDQGILGDANSTSGTYG